MNSFWQDVKITVRLYVRKPLFTIVVLAVLGLAIGVNSAIFTVVNAVLLRPLEYPRASELVRVFQMATDTQARRPGVQFVDGLNSPSRGYAVRESVPAPAWDNKCGAE